MNTSPPIANRLAAAVAATALCAAALTAPAAGGDPPDPLASIQKAGVNATVTIFPVILLEQPNKDVADALGLILEKAGMRNIETTDTVAAIPAGGEFDKVPGLFGKFVAAQAIKTDYALYAAFLGARQTGFTEVRTVIVDKAGALVWSDRQTKADADFKRIAPREPMQCCMLSAERVKTALKLPDTPPKTTGPGRMEKLWAAKSGTPTEAQRAAMTKKLAALKSVGASVSIEIHAVQIGGKSDADAGKHLVELLSAEKLCKPVAAKESPAFKLKPGPNEQRRLWDLAREFQAHVKQNKPAADYTLFAEYLMNAKDKRVGAVHFIVCDRAGEWVIVDFQNDHHDDFNSVSPHTADDCAKLLARRLQGYLK